MLKQKLLQEQFKPVSHHNSVEGGHDPAQQNDAEDGEARDRAHGTARGVEGATSRDHH